MAGPDPTRHPVRPVFVIAAVILAGALSAIVLVLAGSRFATAATPARPPIASRTIRRPVPSPPTLQPTPSHSVQAIMAGLVDPAADGVWNSAGAIVTTAGEESWAPSTDEDWRRLEGHARALARGADALAEPARADGRESWAGPARGLRAASAAALSAAQHRDVDAIHAASELLLDSCQQCHQHYWLPTERAP
jgi:hypothetical protein